MAPPKKIWVVSELFYPETISTGYIMTEIARYLAENHTVSVITGPEFYEEKDITASPKSLENIQINRIKSKGYNKNTFFSRVWGHFTVAVKMLLLMRKKIPRNAEILMVTNPVLLVILAGFFAKRKKWKIKLLVHDVYPENLVVSGLLKSEKSIHFSLLKRIFNNAFRKMDTLIVLGRDMKELFEKKINTLRKIVIIENWTDVETIKAHIPATTEKTFLFAGNMGRLQGIEALLNAIKEVNSEPARFVFIGSGALDDYIDGYITQNKLEDIEKLGWLPREKQNEFLARAHVGIITLKRGMYGLGVPSKLYNLLAAGKPILYIGDTNSEIHRVLLKNKIGWFVEAGQEEKLKNTLLEIIKCDHSVLSEYSHNARKLAENKYSKEKILSKFRAIFTL